MKAFFGFGAGKLNKAAVANSLQERLTTYEHLLSHAELRNLLQSIEEWACAQNVSYKDMNNLDTLIEAGPIAVIPLLVAASASHNPIADILQWPLEDMREPIFAEIAAFIEQNIDEARRHGGSLETVVVASFVVLLERCLSDREDLAQVREFFGSFRDHPIKRVRQFVPHAVDKVAQVMARKP
jgi:hypothetical protein